MVTVHWEPPQEATRKSIIGQFHIKADKRILNNGRLFQGQRIGQAQACIFIEKFVERVIDGNSPAYIFRLTRNNFYNAQETKLGTYLNELIKLLGFFDSKHDYSERLTAFLSSCWLISNVYSVDLKAMATSSFIPSDSHYEAMNCIVDKIRMCSREPWFQRAAGDRRLEANNKAKAIAAKVAETLKHYARTMVVRIDFSYHKSESKRITIDQVYEHLDRLLKLKEQHETFSNLVGYAWAIEHGDRLGFHIHAVFLFDGSKECRDITKGFKIAGLWANEITEGLGKFNLCNTKKADYDELGIGVIERTDSAACLNAIKHIPYITKDTQYLRIKPRGRRTFGAGVTPNANEKRGRPPLQAPSWNY